MAFTNDNLVPVGGHTGEGGGVWYYQSSDGASTVSGANYFDPASNRLEVDSLIIANQNTGGTNTVDIYNVDSISSGTVSVTAKAPS